MARQSRNKQKEVRMLERFVETEPETMLTIHKKKKKKKPFRTTKDLEVGT